ncbi:steroid 17-alpha-hydroxylase/17,20 lyase-like isoform X1 [Gigantopelta aegis]|uniref:steroid 17-alpha-hydroxylase/17,20 lyase-like isoform X1 n=2 Tax=Gigantopelta aegis TaxID=1735272 RepID=UPI001B88CDA1|nr:steroid 17-alpha-hydroxylase/17,20 lyase-like isoform X1 [Gigantopelta aegis]
METVLRYVSALSVTSRTILVASVFGIAAYYLLRKRYRLPPGPTALPLLGNVLSFRGTPMYQKLAEWSKTYGPVMTVYLGPIRCVALNNTEVVLEALVKKQADFAGRPQTYSTKLLSDGAKSIALGDYHATWRLHRKLATKALRLYTSGNRLELRMTESLNKVVEVLKGIKEPVNPHLYNSLVALNILFGVCFDQTYAVDDPMFKNMLSIFDEFLTSFGNGPLEDIIPPLRLCPTKQMKRMIQLFDDIFNILDIFIVEHRNTLSPDHIRDFTDSILLAQKAAMEELDEATMSKITDDHVRQTIGDIFGAGIDTTRLTLDWAILYLASHPEVPSKIHKEVDQVLPKSGTMLLSYRNHLPYTEAVLHEVMRLSSVVPLSLPHCTICDTKIGDNDVPQGTMVLLNLWMMHHDPDKWTDVEAFKPERFLDETGAMAPKPDSWLPFSAGRRVCLGESVAKQELVLLLAGYMRQFKISLPDGVKPDFEAIGGGFVRTPKPFQSRFCGT